ncbi:MAG: DNA polymerase III subunit beta [Desulfobacteraceae bacterium]|nr:DNA polymerase III subunit beta [Desulfobacteraceae bacterium]
MKFIVQKNDIVDVLAKIQGLTGRRSSLAITECINISSSEKGIHLIATDLETGYEGSFPASVEISGVISISARKLYEIVREFPSSEILIEEKENRFIDIGNQKVQYHLKGMNPDDFPNTPTFEAVDFFEVGSTDFKKMIDKTVSISGIGEDKKPHINGAYFERLTESKPFVIRMLSTDGSRLSKYDLKQSEDKDIPVGDSVLVPKKGLHEISKFLGSGGAVRVGIQGSYFIVKSEFETLYIRMLEGNYPKYEEILFREEGFRIEVDKERFTNMLKRMSILCNDSYRAAIFKFKADELVIKATNPDIGESKEDMGIEYNGEVIEAAFNPKFFIDAVNNIDDKKLIINIVSEDRPCLIEGTEDKSYTSAIMPMRV